MQTLESLKRTIKSTHDLLSVVKTMKALAAVSIRQYQRAVEALLDYSRNVEMGLQVVLRSRPREEMAMGAVPLSRVGAIVFGSDQGLCGQFNAQVVAHALDELDRLGVPEVNRYILTVGERAKDYVCLGQRSQTTSRARAHRGRRMVQEIVMILGMALPGPRSSTSPLLQPLPVGATTTRNPCGPARGQSLLDEISRGSGVALAAMFTQDWDTLFLALLREYLFVSIYRAFTESLASENASRLASMQNAEKNIQEHLEEIHMAYHRQRQMTITEELLDIVSGYEAMKGGAGPEKESSRVPDRED